jgi:hypothetical protein
VAAADLPVSEATSADSRAPEVAGETVAPPSTEAAEAAALRVRPAPRVRLVRQVPPEQQVRLEQRVRRFASDRPRFVGLDSNCPVPWTMRLGCPRIQSEHKVYISRYGDDMPDIKGWTRGRETLAQRTGSTEADNV